MKKLIFVYGTLLEGYGNHAHFLKGKGRKLGGYTTEPEFTMYDVGYFPGVKHEGNTSIIGEVYEVDEETFQHIDGLEGYNPEAPQSGLYNRKQINTPWGEAWIYIINHTFTQDNIVASGSWRTR